MGIQIDGEWREEVAEVKSGIFKFFKAHFSRRQFVRPRLGREFGGRNVSEDENQLLLSPFSEEEVLKAVNSCDSAKSRGPDGFNFSFFKKFWDVIKAELMRFLGEFYCNGRIVNGLNTSFVVLIPKKEETQNVHDYRPISLIGGAYKILSKVLANRLSKIVGSIILENQSAFIAGRQMLDSVVSLNEAMDNAKVKKAKCMMFKIDFAKAYDTMDWGYLKEIMECLDFNKTWIEWIMECVSSAQASVLVNGSPSGNFKLGRGLRQGDPLSPFLFSIAAKGISRLMNKAVENGSFTPMEVGRDMIRLSHLQFVDDTLFVGASTEENLKLIGTNVA